MRAPESRITSGIRNEPPISTSCPRETTTSLPLHKAVKASSTAAALLFTTSAASLPNRAVSKPATSEARSPRLPVDRSSSRLLYPAATPSASTAAWESGALEELDREQDDDAAGPDLAPAEADVVEEASVLSLEDRLDHVPAIQPGDRQQLKREDREVQEHDHVDDEAQESWSHVERDGYACADHRAQQQSDDEGHRQVCCWTTELVEDLLPVTADAVGLDGHPAAPADQRHEHRDHPQRVEEAARTGLEVAEVADGAIALEVGRRGVAHLMRRDGDGDGRHQGENPDDEGDEKTQSILIFESRFVVRRLVRARLTRVAAGAGATRFS